MQASLEALRILWREFNEVSPEQLVLGQQAWAVICSTILDAIREVIATGTQELPKRWQATLSETGTRLMADDVDWIEMNGIDRWVGGIDLRSKRESVYRYAD